MSTYSVNVSLDEVKQSPNKMGVGGGIGGGIGGGLKEKEKMQFGYEALSVVDVEWVSLDRIICRTRGKMGEKWVEMGETWAF